MRFRTSMTVAAGAALAGLTLAGCSASASSSSAANSATVSATTPGAQASPSAPAAATAPTASAAATAPTASVAATAPAASTQQAVTTCKPTGLSYALGAKTGSSQVTQAVDLTNTGSSACTMRGYPGVDLVGQANGNPNYTWSLIRQSAVNRGTMSYSTVTLQPGATAHFNLIYLPGVAGQGVNIFVLKMVITPPNDFTQAQLTWGQLVLLQDAMNYPGTYISPVMPGA